MDTNAGKVNVQQDILNDNSEKAVKVGKVIGIMRSP